jgi:hypothetical protein
VLRDAIEALGRDVAVVVCRLAPIAAPWPLAAVIAGGCLLAPLRT